LTAKVLEKVKAVNTQKIQGHIRFVLAARPQLSVMMEHIHAPLSSHSRLELCGGRVFQIAKVVAGVIMVETAILFPLANISALWFKCA